MANGLTPEYLEQMRRNIPHTFTKTIKELRADIDNLLDKSMSLGDVYFDNIDNLKYDWGTINGVLGRKITSNDIYSNLEFSTKA